MADASALVASPMSNLHRLFQDNYDRIWRLLRGLGVPSDRIDDATQQVFLVFAERQADVLPGRESSFLYGTALRVAYSARAARREVASEIDENVRGDLPDADELSDQKRARDLLARILEGMEPDLRNVFVLYELEELTVPEIAEVCALPLGTAASRLRRAREQFSEKVQRYSASRASVRPKRADSLYPEPASPARSRSGAP